MDEILPFVANEIYEASSRKIRLATFVIKEGGIHSHTKGESILSPKIYSNLFPT